jgi:hypothetical protein
MVYINVDLKDLLDLKDDLKPKVEQELKKAAEELSIQAHAHITEQVQQKLHSTREKYLAAMKFDNVEDGTWVITLDEKAMWIEEGMESHEMLNDLLASPKAKTAKDGSKYLSVPFQHNKGPTQQTQAQNDLTNTLKTELKNRKIPYGKLEMDANGKPKLGLLHKFDILKDPIKTQEGPGQGWGPAGQVRQGPTGIPFLQSVRIYQRQISDANGKSKTVRNIMTFRTASSKHIGTGRWVHPGLEAKKFFDEAEKWATEQWTTKIAPQILRNLSESL